MRSCYALAIFLSHFSCDVIGLEPIRDESIGVEGLYWCIDYPWPMSDRDVSFAKALHVVRFV